ncbi:MAG TPA: methyltransferase domain-containing protein [Bryobacteraceae bacterium]|nr:methyltransferase domain-containing protein [Bryobacteraceae bacterium]
MLICPVRGCRQPLTRQDRRYFCPSGHSFDVARSGYVNLLQPQDRRSKSPGDTPEAVAARRRLQDRGITRPLLSAMEALLPLGPSDSLLDAGCGEGFYLGNRQGESGCTGHGVDISIPAIDAAARRYADCEWVVANADRAIPYGEGSFTAVQSITARMNAPEFFRVLQPGGRLLVAIPAPEDLIELRGAGKDRVERTIDTFAGSFRLEQTQRVTTTAQLDAAGIQDVLHAIYRPLQNEAPRAADVTFSLDLLLFLRADF